MAVEFALVSVVLFTMLFGILEVARIMYLWNTLQEVTRRAASGATVADFSDAGAMDQVRQNAIFKSSPGTLTLGNPVTDAYVRIDYLSLARDSNGAMTLTPIPASLLPACPARNLLNCATDPYGSACIRFVRARICAPGGGNACTPVAYAPMTQLPALAVTLPSAVVVAKASTLGYQSGDAVCP